MCRSHNSLLTPHPSLWFAFLCLAHQSRKPSPRPRTISQNTSSSSLLDGFLVWMTNAYCAGTTRCSGGGRACTGRGRGAVRGAEAGKRKRPLQEPGAGADRPPPRLHQHRHTCALTPPPLTCTSTAMRTSSKLRSTFLRDRTGVCGRYIVTGE